MWGKGLGEVVVRAAFESREAISGFVFCGKKNNRNGGAFAQGSQIRAERKTIPVRQGNIQNCQVGLNFLEGIKGAGDI